MNVGATRTASRKPVWKNTITLPWAPTGQVFFSPIIQIDGEYIVYVIDQAQVFYSYNITTATWTALTGPDYTCTAGGRVGFNRTLCMSPDETTIACITEGVAYTSGAEATKRIEGGLRIEFYDIVDDSWAASSQSDFTISGYPAYIRAIVWEDDDTLWAWCTEAYSTASQTNLNIFRGKCVKYIKSTDVWTPSDNLFRILGRHSSAADRYGIASVACINAAGTIVYLGGTGSENTIARDRQWSSYTIATDDYLDTAVDLSPLTDSFAYAYNKDLLAYYEAGGNCQQGCYDPAAAYYADDLFGENADRDSGYGQYFGMSKNAGLVVALISASAPEIGIFTE